ncbi:GNAT family N-acetyltransferase [Zavarzinia sp. CC-PAN008]|uniref:GNAT family N-acetyltransferase n=1 Tax=Zavarzinia sp. CC-PAN008 TaxID=3243332 RepID=UPI003F7477BB
MTQIESGARAAVSVSVASSLGEVAAADWDACAGGDNPFVSHAFLSALEDSGSATTRTGWQPIHLVARDAGERVVGVMPLYAKSHSYGEYVFDHSWAAAYERAGGRYYPKGLCAVPFTPATGPRLLAHPAADGPRVRRELAQAATTIMRQNGIASLNVNFVEEAQAAELEGLGFLHRTDTQFHWENRGYATFDDFLATLASRKRKQIRHERAGAVENGVELHVLTGSDLKEEHWDAFWRFYQDTGSRKWGSPYLTRRFFSLVSERMADRIALVLARRQGRWIAGALNFIGREALFGRNWGCLEEHRFLHFEACYYQAIQFAIARGLSRVEAGAQGEHKLARGYLPRLTHSLHWIADGNFRQAVATYLERERAQVAQDAAFLTEHGPYRHEERE